MITFADRVAIITSMWREADRTHVSAATASRSAAVIEPSTIWTR